MSEKISENTIYHKRVISFIDGSLSSEEKSEFEAYVRTHPEFEQVIKDKVEELAFLKNLLPAVNPPKDVLESLETEMEFSIMNLLKEEPSNLWEIFKNKFEDWFNR